ncbi:hypothetical protein [Thalassoglobus sp.]|uniref:hypothetical protein n=1 Tax=Thalassoglobus sp. TaxID=2795869 RepID=UPI003AA95E7E
MKSRHEALKVSITGTTNIENAGVLALQSDRIKPVLSRETLNTKLWGESTTL